MAQGRGTINSGMAQTPLLEHFPPLARNRNYLLLFGSYVVSVLGDRVHFLVMLQLLCIVILRQKAVDSQHFAQLNLAMFLPFFLLAPLAGIVADRIPRRRIMISCDLSRAVLVVIARTVLLAGAMGRWMSVPQLLWLLFGSEVVLSIFGEMFSPARAAILPNLVHPQQLLQANAWINPAGTIVTLIGFLVGGWLVTRNLSYAMYVDAVTYCISAVCVITMRLPPGVDVPAPANRGKSMRASLRQGVSYLRRHTRPLQVISLELGFFAISTLILNSLPSLVHRRFHLGPRHLYFTMALTGLGMIAGALALSRTKQNIPKEIGIGWSVVLLGIGLLLAAHAHSWPVMVLWLMVAACFGSIMFISVDTLLQRIVPDFMRGRVMGVRDLVTTAGLITMTLPMALLPDMHVLVVKLVYAMGTLSLLLGIGLVIFYYRGQPLPAGQAVILRIFRVYMVVWHGYRRVGPCRIPAQGPVIIVCNHGCRSGPLALLISSPRRFIRLMVAQEYRHTLFLGRLLRWGQAIPRQRVPADAASLRSSLRVLRAGCVLGLFLDGGISEAGRLEPAPPEIAALALMSRAPVVPVYVHSPRPHGRGFRNFFRPARVRLYYGSPLHFTNIAPRQRDCATLEEVAGRIKQAMTKLQAKVDADNAPSAC